MMKKQKNKKTFTKLSQSFEGLSRSGDHLWTKEIRDWVQHQLTLSTAVAIGSSAPRERQWYGNSKSL